MQIERPEKSNTRFGLKCYASVDECYGCGGSARRGAPIEVEDGVFAVEYTSFRPDGSPDGTYVWVDGVWRDDLDTVADAFPQPEPKEPEPEPEPEDEVDKIDTHWGQVKETAEKTFDQWFTDEEDSAAGE